MVFEIEYYKYAKLIQCCLGNLNRVNSSTVLIPKNHHMILAPVCDKKYTCSTAIIT